MSLPSHLFSCSALPEYCCVLPWLLSLLAAFSSLHRTGLQQMADRQTAGLKALVCFWLQEKVLRIEMQDQGACPGAIESDGGCMAQV